jgi:hypothetical protein
MKQATHFLPKRQSVIYAHTERMIRETGTNRRSFAMEVADRYLQLVAEDDREVPFRITLGGDLDADKKHNGQILGRYLDAVVKTLPADLEDAWVMSLPDTYRAECERDLGRRRGILPISIPQIEDSNDTAGVGRLMGEFGDLVTSLSPALSDGVIDEKDLPHVAKILNEADDVMVAVLTLRKRFSALLAVAS